MYGKMQEYLCQTLAEIKEAGLYKEERLIESAQQAAITVKGKEVLNFCANNYLGLSNHPRLIKASQEMMNNRGYGMSSVRFICGTQDIHKELEAAISEYFQTEDTILYADVTDGEAIASVVKEYHIDTIYNLAALLSVVAESKPKLAWKIGIDGLWNVLEVAREQGCAVFTPSSIGSFGASTPHTKTPQDTIQRPRTMYGVTKVTTELLSDYYFNKYGVDTRAVRFPGMYIISIKVPCLMGHTNFSPFTAE